MRKTQKILFIILFLFSSFSVVTYISCLKKDACSNVICLNGGACDGGKCQCLVGFEGPICDTLSRDKFVFSYSGGDSCGKKATTHLDSFGYRQYNNSLRLTARIYKPLELMMTNFLNNPDDSAVCTMIKRDSFSFIGANNGTMYQGLGWLRHDTLNLVYRVDHDTTSYDCKYMGLVE